MVLIEYWVESCIFAALCSYQSRINAKVFVFFLTVLFGYVFECICFVIGGKVPWGFWVF